MTIGRIAARAALAAAAASAAPLAAQTASPQTIEDYVRIYGGEAAARSFAAARTLQPFEGEVTLAQGCSGSACTVQALLLDARPRAVSSRALCFANALPGAATGAGAGGPTPGMLTHAELSVPTPQGPAKLAYRVYARIDPRDMRRARPLLSGDTCVALPAALEQAGVTIAPLPPRDPRYDYTIGGAARLTPRRLTGVVPVTFDPAAPTFAEMMIRTATPGAVIAIAGRPTRLKTPVSLSAAGAATGTIELRRGKAVAKLDRCPSQWSAEHAAFVLDCAL